MPAERESRQRRIVAQALAGDADIRSTVMQQRFDFLRVPCTSSTRTSENSSRKALMTGGRLARLSMVVAIVKTPDASLVKRSASRRTLLTS